MGGKDRRSTGHPRAAKAEARRQRLINRIFPAAEIEAWRASLQKYWTGVTLHDDGSGREELIELLTAEIRACPADLSHDRVQMMVCGRTW